MNKRQKLELTWIGKEHRPELEPRILLGDPDKSYHAKHRVTDHDLFDNRLIFGDNLLALRALEQEFAGKIRCIYIDPPFNTEQAFEHYDDATEHSIWLSLLRDRLELLRRLLSNEGSLAELAEKRKSFAFETTLSGLAYAHHIPRWQAAQYYVTLIFLSLPSPEMAIARVEERVRQGGHGVPETVIRRRFSAGLQNFHRIYRDMVDAWSYYDNSGAEPVLLDWGEKS